MTLKNLKFSVSYVLSILVMGSFLLCGCSTSNKVINTRYMPGHKASDMMKSVAPSHSSPSSQKTGITRTKSGVYIYKDSSVINTTGYEFKENGSRDVGPSDPKFDAEKFRTRY